MTRPSIDLPACQARLELALSAGRAAGRLILDYYRSDRLGTEWKEDLSPVTVADRHAESLLRDEIRRRFPDDGVLGEEHGEIEGRSGYRWILDPIDGTRSFVHGVPLFGTLIGVEFGGRSVLGACLFPALGESLHAIEGQGSWYEATPGAQATPARVSEVRSLREAALCITSVRAFEETGTLAVYDALWRAARLTRGWSDCYAYALVATGRVDVVVDPSMHLWDCAALQPILDEAGGVFTDWTGASTIYSRQTIGSNRALLADVLAVTRPAADR